LERNCSDSFEAILETILTGAEVYHPKSGIATAENGTEYRRNRREKSYHYTILLQVTVMTGLPGCSLWTDLKKKLILGITNSCAMLETVLLQASSTWPSQMVSHLTTCKT
jgi:hypothetical protein